MLFATTGIHTHTHTNLKDFDKPKVHHVFINQIAAIMCTCRTMTSVMRFAAHGSLNIQRTAVPKGHLGALTYHTCVFGFRQPHMQC